MIENLKLDFEGARCYFSFYFCFQIFKSELHSETDSFNNIYWVPTLPTILDAGE